MAKRGRGDVRSVTLGRGARDGQREVDVDDHDTMSDDTDGTSPPSRALTWGDPAARDALFLVAHDVRSRAGFGTCAIEVLRSDELLESVAISD